MGNICRQAQNRNMGDLPAISFVTSIKSKAARASRLLKNHPPISTKKDVFEEMVGVTFSKKYVVVKNLVDILARDAGYFSAVAGLMEMHA